MTGSRDCSEQSCSSGLDPSWRTAGDCHSAAACDRIAENSAAHLADQCFVCAAAGPACDFDWLADSRSDSARADDSRLCSILAAAIADVAVAAGDAADDPGARSVQT